MKTILSPSAHPNSHTTLSLIISEIASDTTFGDLQGDFLYDFTLYKSVKLNLSHGGGDDIITKILPLFIKTSF